ncbi:MAG: HD domain-containing protein, partial [Planctomycetaceae bacterium]
FLLRIRTELHFHAGKPQEILTREEQVRLAVLFGFPGDAAQRPVEQFMRQYLLHVTAIADIATRFVHRHRPGQLAEQFRQFCTSRRDNLHFRVTPREIFPARRSRELVLNSPGLLLQMYELGAGYRVKVTAELDDAIRQAAPNWPQPPAPEVAERFLSILRHERGVGAVLRELFSVGLLEYVLPEFQHVRCLLQFNQYHAYTVDEHTLRAIEAAESLLDQRGVLAETARGLRRRELLHLALLLHDAAKGYVEDHCVLGEELARRVGPRLGLCEADTDTVAFLVRQHLSMTVTAFRRDLNDPALLLEFARHVGGAERLRLLFVHSAADMLAVGPHTFTSWKEDLLAQLYEGAMANLTGTAARDLTPLRRELALRLRSDANGTATAAMHSADRGLALGGSPGVIPVAPPGIARALDIAGAAANAVSPGILVSRNISGVPGREVPVDPRAEAVATEGSTPLPPATPNVSPEDWALVESLPAHYLTATPP